HDRRAPPLTHHAARRTLHPHPQHHPDPPKRRHLQPTDQADHDTNARARADQELQTRHVVTTDPAAATTKARPETEKRLPPQRNFGLVRKIAVTRLGMAPRSIHPEGRLYVSA